MRGLGTNGNRGSGGRVSGFGLCGGEWVVLSVRVWAWDGVCVCCEYGFLCEYGRSMYLYIVLVGYLRILGVPCVQSW